MCIVELFYLFFFFKHKTAYEMRIRDCSSDVCSSDLHLRRCSRKSRPDLKETADKCPKLPGDFPERSADSTIAAALPDQLTYTVDLRRNLGKRGTPLGGGQQANEIGRAHVCTPVTNAHLVCRLLLDKKLQQHQTRLELHNIRL